MVLGTSLFGGIVSNPNAAKTFSKLVEKLISHLLGYLIGYVRRSIRGSYKITSL